MWWLPLRELNVGIVSKIRAEGMKRMKNNCLLMFRDDLQETM